MNDPRDITHNLRTAIVDADGKLVKVYTGNDWTPDQVLADLQRTRRWSEVGPAFTAARTSADRAAADARQRSSGI